MIVVSIDRWSLYRGVSVSLRWSTDQPTVATVDRWSLYRGVSVSLRWSICNITCELMFLRCEKRLSRR